MGLSSYRDFFLHSEETNHGDHPFIIMMKSENLRVSAELTQYIGHILQRLIVFYTCGRLHIHEESFRKRFAFFSFLCLSVPSFTFFTIKEEAKRKIIKSYTNQSGNLFPLFLFKEALLSQNIGFSSGFSCQTKIVFVRAILRMVLIHQVLIMIQIALWYVPKRSLNFSGFSFRLCPLCLKPISFSP